MSRQSDMDNHANQLNPNNDAYWQSRGYDERPGQGDDEDWDEEWTEPVGSPVGEESAVVDEADAGHGSPARNAVIGVGVGLLAAGLASGLAGYVMRSLRSRR